MSKGSAINNCKLTGKRSWVPPASRSQDLRAVTSRIINVLTTTILLSVAAARTPATSESFGVRSIPPGSTPKEEQIGRRESAAISRSFVLLHDEAALDKLRLMVHTLAKLSERPDIQYQVNIVDEKQPNAFTIPGGYIYVTKGLLDFARTDHELAAVLAHEIGHNTGMHALRMMAKARKLQPYQILSLLSVAFGGVSARAVGAFSQYAFIGILNGFGVEMESEADSVAVDYLEKSSWSPTGIITFMEHMRQEELRRPQRSDPGIFRTHPATEERYSMALQKLRSHGLPLERSLTIGTPPITVASVKLIAREAAEIRVSGEKLWVVGASAEATPVVRAEGIAKRLKEALAHGVRMYQLSVHDASGSNPPSLRLGDWVLIVVLPVDIEINNSPSADALMDEWLASLKAMLWRQHIEQGE
ncbi:MAG: M48 family metalloprotease [Armatimonadetes bacterium]|nr:M48 family metalloprotease [Armatimonadota bacterium]